MDFMAFHGIFMDFTLIFMKKTCCCLLSCWNAWTKVKQRNSQDLRSRCQAAWSPSTQCWWAPNGLSMRFAMIVPWQPVDRFSSSLDHQHFRWCCDMARHGAEPCWALWCLPQLIKSIKSPRFSISSHKNHSSGSFSLQKLCKHRHKKTPQHRKPTTMIEASRCWWWKSYRPLVFNTSHARFPSQFDGDFMRMSWEYSGKLYVLKKYLQKKQGGMYMRSIHDFGVHAGIFQVQFMLVHPMRLGLVPQMLRGTTDFMV